MERHIAHPGTTPAGAGTTPRLCLTPSPHRNYPCGCGDDHRSGGGGTRRGELPPRVRGRPVRLHHPRTRGRNYPRGCGDDDAHRPAQVGRQELPPRVRGRLGGEVAHLVRERTTPAGAGTTRGRRCRRAGRPNYPRGCGDDLSGSVCRARSAELPPRVRGRRTLRDELAVDERTTPAGAGTTVSCSGKLSSVTNYPRGCGDDQNGYRRVTPGRELPPRVRGRQESGCGPAVAGGTTPAGAGTTTVGNPVWDREQNYPRGCGDDLIARGLPPDSWELPPRVRGRPHPPCTPDGGRGTTPAGAGTTATAASRPPPCKNYPRGCGDDGVNTLNSLSPVELPPRVRGRLRAEGAHAGVKGTTPAGAGTTAVRCGRGGRRANYPRGCGDDSSVTPDTPLFSELPPRVRGRRHGDSPSVLYGRTTPAGAGTTQVECGARAATPNYPRGCGDDAGLAKLCGKTEELPPRVRGRRVEGGVAQPAHGTTPAGAGTTAFHSAQCRLG